MHDVPVLRREVQDSKVATPDGGNDKTLGTGELRRMNGY